MNRLPASVHLAVLAVAAVPVGAGMSVAWWVLYPAWLLSRRTDDPGSPG